MSSYFRLYIVVLFMQNFPVKSCNSQWLKQTIFNRLKNGKIDQAAGNIGTLSNCNKGVLKEAVNEKKSTGLAKKFRDAAQKAYQYGWGNSDVLKECIAILCEGGSMCPSRSPFPTSDDVPPGFAQQFQPLLVSLINLSANDLTAAYAEVVQGTDVGIALENSVTDITSTIANSVSQIFQQSGALLDETFTQALIEETSANIVGQIQKGLVDATSSLFQKCSQNTQSTVTSVTGIIESKNLWDVITTTPNLSQQESAFSQVQNLIDFFEQVAKDAYIQFATQILNVVDDTCTV